MRYVWDDPTVLALMSLQAIPAFLIMPYTQLLPIFARDILHTGPEGLGTLMTANGIGSVLGSVVIVLLPSRRQGLFLFASLASFGLLLAAFAASTWLPLSIGIMGLIGVAQAIYLATNNTLVQLATPDELHGRVMSVYMMTWGLMPLGALPQGILADWFGAPIVTAGDGPAGLPGGHPVRRPLPEHPPPLTRTSARASTRREGGRGARPDTARPRTSRQPGTSAALQCRLSP